MHVFSSFPNCPSANHLMRRKAYFAKSLDGVKLAVTLEEGIEKGREEGEFKNKIETARNMKILGLSMDVIIKSVGLSVDQLRENGIF